MALPTDWMTADWPAPARVRTLLTTRAGGVSLPPFDSMNLAMHVGDEPGAVAQNRQRLRALLPADPCWLQQVHGTRVVDAAEAASGREQADGCVAQAPGQVCAVLAADCLPVLLCDRAGTVVAAAHAGWRGLSAGVLEQTIGRMPVAPGQLLAYLGPAIGPTAFEVGADVRDAFCAGDPGAGACFEPKPPGPMGEPKWFGDLAGLARRRLQALGVRQVTSGELCTFCEPARFFSHRRDRRSGRQAALVWLDS